MPYKKKATPGTVQFHQLIAELPDKRDNIKAPDKFRNDILESQKRVNYKNESDRLQSANQKTARIGCQCKTKNERTTEESATITERRTISSYLFY